MPQSNDCANTQSSNGQNLTPIKVVEAVLSVLGEVHLDPASDEIANETAIKARKIYTLKDDGFSLPWVADTVFLNAPGRSLAGGTHAEREAWRAELLKQPKDRAKRPKGVRQVEASAWYRRLFHYFCVSDVGHAIGLVYRGGSVGSLGVDLLSAASICITAAGARSMSINGSGRFAFDIVEGGERVKQTMNTQNSMLFLLSDSKRKHRLFSQTMREFGVVK